MSQSLILERSGLGGLSMPDIRIERTRDSPMYIWARFALTSMLTPAAWQIPQSRKVVHMVSVRILFELTDFSKRKHLLESPILPLLPWVMANTVGRGQSLLALPVSCAAHRDDSPYHGSAGRANRLGEPHFGALSGRFHN